MLCPPIVYATTHHELFILGCLLHGDKAKPCALSATPTVSLECKMQVATENLKNVDCSFVLNKA